MKKIQFGCLVLICLFFVTACNQGGQKLISIKVQLVHIPKNAKRAYLAVIKPAGTFIIDTTKINPLKGNFTFHIPKKNQESLYRIHTGKDHSFLLVAGDKDIKITGDYSHAGKMHIKGSQASIELQHFITGLNKQNTALNKLAKRINNPSKKMKDSLTNILKYRLQQGKQAILDTVLNRARITTSPAIALFSLSILDNNGAWQKGKPLFDGLTTRFPISELVKKAVDNYKRKLNNMGKTLAVSIGDEAPNLRYPNPKGKIISLSGFRGKYVLLDFWASWCAPCRAANPGLVKAYNRFKNKNFTILSVSLDTKKSSWIKAIKHDGLTWDQISDLRGWNSSPAAIYNVNAIPTNFLIGPKGKILAKDLYGKKLEKKLTQILNSKTTLKRKNAAG